MSKDVRRLRQFEETLLLDYQHFLSQCDETIKGKKKYHDHHNLRVLFLSTIPSGSWYTKRRSEEKKEERKKEATEPPQR